MAKKRDLAKRSNKRSLASLVDENLQKESKLLQNLIERVIEANRKVKQTHEERLEKTDEKLQHLNNEIDRLKKEISRVDQETTIKQLNYLLDSKDRIFDALEEMRSHYVNAFTSKSRSDTIENLRESLFSMLEKHRESLEETDSVQEQFTEAPRVFVEKVLERATKHFNRHHFETAGTEKVLKQFDAAARTFNETFEPFRSELEDLLNSRSHMLLYEEDQTLEARIDATYQERKEALDTRERELREQFEEQLQSIDARIESIEQDNLERLKQKHARKLEAEQELRENLQKDLKELRLQILNAERQGNTKELKDLLETYERKQTSSESMLEEKLAKKARQKSGRKRRRLMKERYRVEKNYLEQLHEIHLEREKESIQFNDSHELFKLKEDHKALEDDLRFNDDFIELLKDKLEAFDTFNKQTVSFIGAFHELLITQHEGFLNEEVKILEALSPLKQSLREAHLELVRQLRLKNLKQRRIDADIRHRIRLHEINTRHHQALYNIDKHITDSHRQSSIDRLAAEEEAQSEIIYQRGLIELADKEYELQLLKIQSLYDNEMNLTKAQTDRLNIGQDVSEAMVSTTIESQIHFAKQQIEFAENEYELRLENIDRALNKELEYAREKLEAHRQPYKTDIHELKRARDEKLEDIAYKQALFTEDKERRRLEEQKQRIKEDYQARIDDVKRKESEDSYVQRYRKQIEAAEARAEKAREDARRLKERTVSTFEDMLESSEQKLEQFQNAESQEDSLAPYIESEASSTAKKRYEESLEEAREIYEEKVREPKARIKELEKKLETLHGGTDDDTRDAYQKHREELKAEHEQALEKEKARHQETLDKLEAEENAFLEDARTRAEQAAKESIHVDDAALRRALKSRLERLRRDQQEARKQRLSTLNKGIRDRRKRLDNLKRTLDSHLMEIDKQYGAFLKKQTSSQRRKEAKAERRLQARKRKEIRELKRRYKSE